MAKITDMLEKKVGLEEGQIKKGYREGIEVEKAVTITESFLEERQEFFEKYLNHFSAYPDLFLDLITPTDSNFSLYFYQRLFLRACLRFRYHYTTACFTKGTLVITKNGNKPIEDIQPNDFVKTHKGWEKVLSPVTNHFEDNLYKFTDINGVSFTCTPDHVILTNHGWITAERAYEFGADGCKFIIPSGNSPDETVFFTNDFVGTELGIKKIEQLPKQQQEVYCLSVERIPSFSLANGVIVSNCRAFSKTFLSILALYLECVFMPGRRLCPLAS